jgi:hypothetical protein
VNSFKWELFSKPRNIRAVRKETIALICETPGIVGVHMGLEKRCAPLVTIGEHAMENCPHKERR